MIHKYKMNGMNIVLDVNSGAIHVVEDIVYDILDLFKDSPDFELEEKLKNKYGIEQFNEALMEVNKLKEEGLIFSEDTYKDFYFIRKNDFQVKAICLNVAHDCNLRCKYCFASTGAIIMEIGS